MSLALLSCGGEPTLSSAGGKISSADLQNVIMNITDAIAEMTPPVDGSTIPGPTFGNVTPSVFGARFLGPYDGCTKIVEQDIDGDSDGIVKSRKYTFNCRNVVDSGNKYNLVGYHHFTDKNDSIALPEGGYNSEFDVDFAYKIGNDNHRFLHKGFYDYEKVGASYKYNSKSKVRTIYTEENVDFQMESNWEFIVTPTSSTTGSAKIKGFWGITGSGKTSGTPWKVNVAFSVESKELKYDDLCGYNDGQMTLTDGAKNKIVLTYAGSCTPTVTYNGKPL